MSRQQPRDWPTWPVPFAFLQECYNGIVRDLWPDIPPWSLLSEGSLRSALAAPYAQFGGVVLYPSVPAKAACLFRGLVKNHALHDGNKRLGVVATTVFLLINGWQPRYTSSELYLYALRVANRKGNYRADWIEGWIRRKCRLAPARELRTARRQLDRFWADLGFESIQDAIDSSGVSVTVEHPHGRPPIGPEGTLAMVTPENGRP